MGIIKVSTMNNNDTGESYTKIKTIKPVLEEIGVDKIVMRCKGFPNIEGPFYIVISDTGEYIDYNNAGIDITNGDWVALRPDMRIEI